MDEIDLCNSSAMRSRISARASPASGRAELAQRFLQAATFVATLSGSL
jgi:hypothetical protein